jgi:DNA gyrase subunit A
MRLDLCMSGSRNEKRKERDQQLHRDAREYLDYAMSVITARALPDVRDGLKPVHRRILFAMHELGLTVRAQRRANRRPSSVMCLENTIRTATSVYDAMVKMAQDFTMRYPLIIGQGNFGSIDGDGAAAYRYTEAKMSRLAGEMLKDIEKETVEFRPNYDNTKMEPTSLPRRSRIFSSMARSASPSVWRPTFRRTICAKSGEAAIHLIDNPDATTEDLAANSSKGPIFRRAASPSIKKTSRTRTRPVAAVSSCAAMRK